MFDYPHLKVLLAVEREGSLERAAKSQMVTKSALSQTLGLLEQRLGAVVLDRVPMQPTVFGARLCRHYEQVSLLEQSFFARHAHLFDVGVPPRILLNVGVSDDALATWFTDVVTETEDLGNTALFDIELMTKAHAAKAMTEHRLSCAISTSGKPAAGFEVHSLGSHTIRAVASPDFVENHLPDGPTCDAVKAAPLVRYGADDHWPEHWFRRVFNERAVLPSHHIPSAYGHANACLDGTAWALCSDVVIKKHLESGALVELSPGSEFSIDIYWHIGAHVADTLRPITAALRSAGRNALAHSRCQDRHPTFP